MLVALMGCATSQSSTDAARPGGDVAADYYPLAPGWGWAYDVEREGTQVLALYSVVERTGQVAIIKNADDRIEYLTLPDGIARGANRLAGDYILKNPVRTGVGWMFGDGEAKVVATGQTVALPSGTYRECATIEETRREPDRVTRTTYCRAIGPVEIEVRVYDPMKRSFETVVRARLRSVTRPEDAAGLN